MFPPPRSAELAGRDDASRPRFTRREHAYGTKRRERQESRYWIHLESRREGCVRGRLARSAMPPVSRDRRANLAPVERGGKRADSRNVRFCQGFPGTRARFRLRIAADCERAACAGRSGSQIRAFVRIFIAAPPESLAASTIHSARPSSRVASLARLVNNGFDIIDTTEEHKPSRRCFGGGAESNQSVHYENA